MSNDARIQATPASVAVRATAGAGGAADAVEARSRGEGTPVRVRLLLSLVACLAAVGAPAAAQEGDYETTKGISEEQYTEFVNECYSVETEHGTIHGEVTRPVVPDGVKVPIILTYSPYTIIRSPQNAPGCNANDAVGRYFAPRGYARASFDVVGTRESGG